MDVHFIPQQNNAITFPQQNNATTFPQQNNTTTFPQQNNATTFQQLQQNFLDLTSFAHLSEQIASTIENQEVQQATQNSEDSIISAQHLIDINPNPSQFISETDNKKRKFSILNSSEELQTSGCTDDNVSDNATEVSTTTTATSSTSTQVQNAAELLFSTIPGISENKEFCDSAKIGSGVNGEISDENLKRLKLSPQEFEFDIKNVDIIAETTKDQRNFQQLNEELDLSQHLLKFCGIQFPKSIHELPTNLSKPHETPSRSTKLLSINEHGNYFIRNLQSRSTDLVNSATKNDPQSTSNPMKPPSGIKKIYLKSKNSNSEAYVFTLKPQNKVFFLKDSRIKTSEGGSQQRQQQSLLSTIVENKDNFNNNKMLEEFLKQKRKEQKRVKDETWKKFLTRYCAICSWLIKHEIHL